MSSVYVELEECQRMNDLHDDGMAYMKIADRLDRSYSTVAMHCSSGCDHIGREAVGIDTIDDIGAYVEQLAEEIQRVPGPKDWDHWEDRPCSSQTVMDRYGPWEDVLELSGLPIVPIWSPKPIRALAYQKPEFTEPFPEQ